MNISQDELATKMGYSSRSSIAKIEADINDISITKLFEFAKVLDIPVQKLLDDNY